MAPTLLPAGIEQFCRSLEALTGLAYTPERDYLFESRLRPVIEQYQVRDYLELESLLQGHAPARQTIVEALVTCETYFFRDEATFHALPELAARLAPELEPLIIWSVGCSSGQELASIHMALHEALDWTPARYQLHAMDLSAPMLARAQAAIYSAAETARGLSPARRERYLEPVPGGYQLRAPWREATTFHQANVLAGLPELPRPHLIFCRNILIYFNDANKRQIVAGLMRALHPEGYLILGNSETAMPFQHLVSSASQGRISLYTHPERLKQAA